ncbi:MAG: ImmA/IrrE family metallo-endopeptidase [Candidatus Omnitrophota bacterium]|nr:MAG: ImmA/IrrE family metallo-endopeptidase [Candidatus Omnitrophota bacterium]
MELQPIFKTKEQINSEAESFLKKYHPSKAIPIPIEQIIDIQLQIDIISIPGLKDASETLDHDIDAFISSDFRSISVDKYIYDKVATRYRFTLAHEIGHMILHEYLYAQFKFNKMDEFITTINEMPLKERGMVEWQADEFAGLILVPREFLEEKFKKALTRAEEVLNTSFKDSPDFVIDVAIAYLAQDFAVSADVARIRLERDGLKEKQLQ